jgi:hypothetical protein
MTECARRAGCSNLPDYPRCLVCPYAYASPACKQPPGSPCRRPSGHNCPIHVGRVQIADEVAAVRSWMAAEKRLDEEGRAIVARLF